MKQKENKGFTLVELIVVLVILAILAALLVPALTGYIDKARKNTVIAETRMLVQAAQTELSEKYASKEFSDNTATYITIASKDGQGTGAGTVLPDAKDNYNEIVKLAEVPSISDGTGHFYVVADLSAKIQTLIYDNGKGYAGAYYAEEGCYVAYEIGKDAKLDNLSYIKDKVQMQEVMHGITGNTYVNLWSKAYVEKLYLKYEG